MINTYLTIHIGVDVRGDESEKWSKFYYGKGYGEFRRKYEIIIRSDDWSMYDYEIDVSTEYVRNLMIDPPSTVEEIHDFIMKTILEHIEQ